MIISSISFYADSNRLAILEKLQHSLKPVFTFFSFFLAAMAKFEKDNVKIFDGEGFPVRKYHMEIIFEAKEIHHIIQGAKHPTFPNVSR
jgi:hypothetical protein